MTTLASEGFYKSQIKATEDFRRIQAQPRRVWTEEETKDLVSDMTQALKTPKGTMRLRPIQAIALAEIGQYGGLFGPIPVGDGKTLISLLAPQVLESSRPVLLLPAMLVEKTNRERIELSKHWRIPLNIRLISLESLGRVNSATVLEAYRPDFIGIDEAHKVKNKKAAVTKRYIRYMSQHPETKVVVLSGTMCKHGLEDYAHLAHHSLKERSPLPLENGQLMEWAEVLDERTSMSRVDPGALLELCNDEEKALGRFKAARLGYQRRLVETPGVVTSGGAEVACSLYINSVTYDVNKVTEDNFEKLRKTWMTPDDWPLMQAVDVWRHARELALGMHYTWDPRPPKEWLEARALWAKFVRKSLMHSRHLDSPKQVEMAVDSGELRDVMQVASEDDYYLEEDILARWRDVEDTFKPTTKPVWHDDSALKFCEAWGRKHKGIIWTDHSFFGRELARRAGWDYFGQMGLNAAGVPIDLKNASHEGKTIVASRKSNSTGKNLQAWNRSLIVSPPSGGDEMEQTIARTHRPGQMADEVVVDVVFTCAEHMKAWQDALSAAEMVRDTLGQQQKILMADIQVDVSGFARHTGARWVKTLSEKDAGFVLPVF